MCREIILVDTLDSVKEHEYVVISCSRCMQSSSRIMGNFMTYEID
jgi:hypothetical protein